LDIYSVFWKLFLVIIKSHAYFARPFDPASNSLKKKLPNFQQKFFLLVAGWSSPVARQAHNLKVVSSNLAPATSSFL
jgi:hypothetical protein